MHLRRCIIYLTGQELNATTIRLLFNSNKQNRANLKSKELEPIHITPKGIVVHPLYPFRIQHRVLTRWQAHILNCNLKIIFFFKKTKLNTII